MAGKLVLVRHGKTKLNSGGESAERLRGWVNVQLDDDGRKQAALLAIQFKDQPIAKIYSSPLDRALDTATTIQKLNGAPGPVEDVSLYPWLLGHMQGQLVKVILEEMNELVKNENECPEGGEPFKVFRRRYLSFLNRKVREMENLPDGQIIMLVTHSRCLQAAKAWEAAGFPDTLEIDVPTMLNYEQETGPGGFMWVKNT